jgi:hypothetical protein
MDLLVADTYNDAVSFEDERLLYDNYPIFFLLPNPHVGKKTQTSG